MNNIGDGNIPSANSASPSPPNGHNVFKQGIQNFQVSKYKEVEKYYLSETIKLSLLTGPLYCISANMQFLNLNLNSKSSLTDNSVTKNKIISNSRTLSLPFKPTFYTNYKDCVFNLYRQGLLGFYKGNMCRLTFFTATNKLKTTLEYQYHVKFAKGNDFLLKNKKLRELIFYSIADILLNPLLVIESRYSIQNRRKGFRIYNNLLEVLSKSWKELYLGASYSLPRNFVFLLGLNTYFIYPSYYLQIFSVFLAHVLSYPILTIQRNKIFHSIHSEYLPRPPDSPIAFYKYIINNAGIQSLYRGFPSFLLATSLWHLYVPKMAKMKFYKNIFQDEPNKDLFKIDFLEEDEYGDED